MTPLRMTLAAFALLALPTMVHPAFANPAATIEARQANFKAIGRANKGVMDELKKPSPDMAAIRTNATALEAAAKRIPGLFPAGTGPEAGVKTEALPAIWLKPAAFTEAHGKFAAAAGALQAAAASGNIAQVRAAAGNVGPTCKGCHDQFRGKQ